MIRIEMKEVLHLPEPNGPLLLFLVTLSILQQS